MGKVKYVLDGFLDVCLAALFEVGDCYGAVRCSAVRRARRREGLLSFGSIVFSDLDRCYLGKGRRRGGRRGRGWGDMDTGYFLIY